MSALLKNPAVLDLEPPRLSPLPLRLADQPEAIQPPSDSVSTTPTGYSGIEEHSTRFHAFLEYSTSLLFPALFVLCFYFSFAHLYDIGRVWLVVLAIPICLVWGDLMGGLVHWFADTYFSEETPVIGPALIKPFRQHHLYPRDICTHNLVTMVGNVCILAVPLLAFCLYLLWLRQHGLLSFAILCTTLMAAATVATNVFHKWAHQENPSAFARWLQRTRLVLEPSHHELHHTEPFNMHYCITNGWLNPLLNKIKFFRRLEATLGFLGLKTAKARDEQKSSTSVLG